MGGSSAPSVIESPAPPAAPSYGSTMKDYVENYPQLVALQKQYGPEMAQLEYENQSLYSPQYAALQKQMNEQLYPQTAGLQENLASQANIGMSQGLPDDMRQQYVSDFNAGLGMNANAPIGISDRNVALTKLNEQWKNYYQHLGLSAAGRQPLAQGGQAGSVDTGAGLQGALNYAQGNFGTTMQGYNSSLANRIVQPNTSFGWQDAMGIGLGAASIGTSMATGNYLGAATSLMNRTPGGK